MSKGFMLAGATVAVVIGAVILDVFIPWFPGICLAAGAGYYFGYLRGKLSIQENRRERAEVADFWNKAAVTGAPDDGRLP